MINAYYFLLNFLLIIYFIISDESMITVVSLSHFIILRYLVEDIHFHFLIIRGPLEYPYFLGCLLFSYLFACIAIITPDNFFIRFREFL